MNTIYQSETLMQHNEQGYPILGDALHGKIFGALNRPVAQESNLNRSRGLLRRFNINVPVDYPDTLYDGDLPFPELLRQHHRTLRANGR